MLHRSVLHVRKLLLASLAILAVPGSAGAADNPLGSLQQLLQGRSAPAASPAQPAPVKNLQQSGTAAAANAAIAWIDDISGAAKNDVDIADTLVAGQIVTLGPKGKAVIGYFADCRMETIAGGTVTIQDGGSQVAGGKMTVGKMACSGSAAVVASNASEAAAAAKRVTPFAASPWIEQALKVAKPLIRWQAAATASGQVRVFEMDAQKPKMVWQATIKGNRTAYAGPPLAVGMPYAVEVTSGGATQGAVFSIDPGLNGDDALRRTVVLRR